MNLTIDGDDFRLFAKLGIVLQDGAAHKMVFGTRGDSACKVCILCLNEFTDKSEIADEDGTDMLRCNTIKLDELEAASSHVLRTNARYLEGVAATCADNDEFVRIQKAVGMAHTPNGILLDPYLDEYLDPVDVYLHDYMHTLFVDGVLGLTIHLCFEAFLSNGQVGVYESFSTLLSS